jgi:HEAT repeat protein
LKFEGGAGSLAAALKDKDPRVIAAAAWALGKLGKAAARSVPALVRLLKHGDPMVCVSAAEALGRIGVGKREVVHGLRRLLTHKENEVKVEAAWALGKLGPRARAAVPALARIAGLLDKPIPNNEDGGLEEPENTTPLDLRINAVEALGRIGPAARRHFAKLLDLCENRSYALEEEAKGAVGKLGLSLLPKVLAHIGKASTRELGRGPGQLRSQGDPQADQSLAQGLQG